MEVLIEVLMEVLMEVLKELDNSKLTCEEYVAYVTVEVVGSMDAIAWALVAPCWCPRKLCSGLSGAILKQFCSRPPPYVGLRTKTHGRTIRMFIVRRLWAYHGTMLEPSWGHLGRSWRPRGTQESRLGVLKGHVEAIFCPAFHLT